MGISGSLMLRFSHVCIIGEFPIFDAPLNAVFWDFGGAQGLYKKVSG